jgi:hypothetical protein
MDCGLRPAPISRITRAKWITGVAQMAEHLLCKFEVPVPQKKKKNQRAMGRLASGQVIVNKKKL